MKVNFKLTSKHITCKGPDRQSVPLATQLLSHTVATSLRRYQSNDPNAQKLADLIDLINNWMDVMNSRNLNEPLPLKKPIGEDFLVQFNVLDEMARRISAIKCVDRNTLMPFQKGIIISISSTKELFKDMTENFGIEFMMTKKLNQDALENFFSQLRTRGGLDDHPTPLQALYRIRMIILGKNPGIIQKNVNTVLDGLEEEFVMKTVFQKCEIEIPEINKPAAPEDLVYDSDSSSIASSVHSFHFKSETEHDGFLYLMGWIARKFRDQFPYLGDYTKNLTRNTDSMIHDLSYGGLTDPSSKWVEQAKLLERGFQKCHKNGKFRYNRNIVGRLSNLLSNKYPDIPKEIIKAFVKIRTIIRMRALNLQIKEAKSRKRKFIQDKNEKSTKKMKKIVN